MKRNHLPLRMCVGCRTRKPKAELLRLVSPENGLFSLDRSQCRAGRGLYVCSTNECLQRAFRTSILKTCRDKQLLLEQIMSLFDIVART